MARFGRTDEDAERRFQGTDDGTNGPYRTLPGADFDPLVYIANRSWIEIRWLAETPAPSIGVARVGRILEVMGRRVDFRHFETGGQSQNDETNRP